MKKLVYIFLTRPITTLMIFISMIVIGLVTFLNLPIELVPQIEYPRLSVSTSWTNVSPEIVEAFLTSPLESVLSTVKGVKKVSSRSLEGISNIDIEFHSSTNIGLARLEINEKLGSIIDELPYGVSMPRISPYVPKEFKDLQGFLTYTLSANLSASEIRKYAVDYLRASLLSVDGVADVVIKGGNQREIIITIDFLKAATYNVTNQEIIAAVDNVEQIISAGSIKNANNEILVKINNDVQKTGVLLNQQVKNFGNTLVRLKDICTVTDDFSEPQSYYRINGKEAVFIEISKEPGTNIVKVADDVYKKTAELQKTFPPGYSLTKEIDLSKNIRQELRELTKSAIYSFLIVFVVLFLFFRNFTYSFIIITSIIFSLLSTFVFFYIFNLPLNILTIASLILGLGMMVDNSIVVIDYLERKISDNNLKRMAVLVSNIFFPVFASSLTTIAVFIPLIFLTGELKLYLQQFALAITIALLSSLVVSFTFTPMLFSKVHYKLVKYNFLTHPFLKYLKSKERERNNLKFTQGILEKLYCSFINLIYKWKKLSLLFVILLIGLPVWLLPSRIETPIISTPYNFIFDSEFYYGAKKYINYAFGGTLNLFFNYIQKGEVFAYGDVDYIIVSLKLPNGNRIERINKLVIDFEKEVLRYKDNIDNITSNVYDEENAFIQINFKKKQTATSFPYLLKNYLTAYAVRLGGLQVSVYGFGPGFYSGGSSTTSFIVQLRGFNYNRLKDLATELKNLISRNPRIDNVDIDRSFYRFNDEDIYEISAKFDRDFLIRNNISIQRLSDEISQSTSGNLAYNKFKIGNDEVFYTIKYSNYKNIQQNELENFIVSNSGKEKLKIKDVVNFEESKVLSAINREDQQYIRNVSFDYKGPYQYGNEFVKSSIAQIKTPAGYFIKQREFSFLFGEEDEIQIWKILLVAFVLIFMISAGLFESIKNPILILLAIPFSLIGTILLFYIGDYTLDRGAYAGMLLLVGLSVNNSIILVDYLSKNYNHNGLAEIINLSYHRIRPIFTTTFTTIAAMIPLILSSQQSFWKSLSLSVSGGLLLSSIFIVFYVPLCFYLMNKKVRQKIT